MLNETKLKLYMNAYSTRLAKGQMILEIDYLFKNTNRLTDDEIKQVHDALHIK